MAIVIHDAVIVTADDRDAVHYGAAIAIDGSRIAAIGPTPEILARYPAAEKVDGRGKMVMPGFANTHTHLTMTLARGVFEDLSPPHKPPFSGGLSPIPLPSMSADEKRIMAQLGALEALRSGTTFLLEDGSNLDDYAEAHAPTRDDPVVCQAWEEVHQIQGELARVLATSDPHPQFRGAGLLSELEKHLNHGLSRHGLQSLSRRSGQPKPCPE